MAQTLTRLDVLPKDSDVLIPVRAALLMVEAKGVEQLMLDSAVVYATGSIQRQSLHITSAANVGVTAMFLQEKYGNLYRFLCKLYIALKKFLYPMNFLTFCCVIIKKLHVYYWDFRG
ncbi:hypothetical protein ILYODFUR_037483 [Ilyodon furcidens]|uniref:Uncharacterized protein n=1 Tax=Ilyodon furcidens TaxID=33524 RepID=A0ABV0UC25_9TELE